MTAKDNFYQEVKSYNAQRVESITDIEVYAALSGSTLLIFTHPDCEHYDKFDFGRVDDALMLPQVMQQAFVNKSIMPDDVSIILDDFYGDYPYTVGDVIKAILWLWNNTCAFDDVWGKHCTLHVEYEDDNDDVDMKDVCRLTDEQQVLVDQMVDAWQACERAGVHFHVCDNEMYAYNASAYSLEYDRSGDGGYDADAAYDANGALMVCPTDTNGDGWVLLNNNSN